VPAPANRRDDGLLAATLDALEVVGPLPAQPVVHLDAGYDYHPAGRSWPSAGWWARSPHRGIPAPVQAGRRWVIERTHAWGNQYGKLRWCTERHPLVVEFWLALANAAIVCGRLLRRAWTHSRWDGRPRRAHDHLLEQNLGPGGGGVAAKPGVEPGQDVGAVRAVEELGAVGISRVDQHLLGRRGGPEDAGGLLGGLVLVGGD
jgi:hypothetical protein